MSKPEKLPVPLQESILTALIYDAKWGALIALQIKPTHFDRPFQHLAGEVLSYREKYRLPPGTEQLDLLLGDKLTEGEEASFYRRLLGSLVKLKDGLNGEYIAHRVHEFVRRKELGDAVLAAGARWAQGGEGSNEEVESILSTAISKQRRELDTGIFFGTERSLAFLDKPDRDGFSLGFGELDKVGLRIKPGKLYTFVGAKNAGKSWFLVHVGRQALIHRQRVLHVTLEMDTDEVFERYYQNWFVAGWGDEFLETKLELTAGGEFMGMAPEQVRKALVNFRHSDARKRLRDGMKPWGTRLGNLCVKEFPTGKLTVPQLRSYLDYLEDAEKFHPDVLLLDYGDLMEIKGQEPRFALNRIWVDCRGLAVERGMAVVIPTQGNREFMGAEESSARQVTEDISKTFTSDVVLVLQRTGAEARLRLARLFLEFSRTTVAGITVLITQNYSLGQFVCETVAVRDRKFYKELLAKTDNDEKKDDSEK